MNIFERAEQEKGRKECPTCGTHLRLTPGTSACCKVCGQDLSCTSVFVKSPGKYHSIGGETYGHR